MRCTNIDVALLRKGLPCSSRCSNCSNRHGIQAVPRLLPDGARLAVTVFETAAFEASVLDGTVAGDTLFVGRSISSSRNRATRLVTARVGEVSETREDSERATEGTKPCFGATTSHPWKQRETAAGDAADCRRQASRQSSSRQRQSASSEFATKRETRGATRGGSSPCRAGRRFLEAL